MILEGVDYVKAATRVRNYAEDFFQKSGCTKWPTFSQVARALKIPMVQIQEFTNEGIYSLMETQVNTIKPTPLGEHYIEVLEGD